MLKHLITNQNQHLLLSSLNYDELNEQNLEEMFNGILNSVIENSSKKLFEEEFLADYLDVLQVKLLVLNLFY